MSDSDTTPRYNRSIAKSVMNSHCDVDVPLMSSSADPTTPIKTRHVTSDVYPSSEAPYTRAVFMAPMGKAVLKCA